MRFITNYLERAKDGVSVIICCYNSAARLPETLRHLAEQGLPSGFPWEIIVVNNASTDNTAAVARETWHQLQKRPYPSQPAFHVIEEPQPGQMYARKRGAREASYEFLIFCDDDNWLNEHYVYEAQEIMLMDNRIGAAGGQNTAVTDADAYPEWFETYQDKYALGIPAPESGDVSHRGFVLGAGLITRRALFLEVFDEKYPSILNGRNGEQLTTGDDFEYCKRLLLWGYTLYYDEFLKLRHFIPKERLTIAYRERLMEGIIASGKVLAEYDLALRLHKKNKHKNRWRLLLLTPFRIVLARLGWSGRQVVDEQGTLFYLSPFHLRADPAKTVIKKFINRK